MSTPISEELLMAYADNELDVATRATVERALAAEPKLAKRVADHRALRAQMQAAFAGVIEEPIPDKLKSLLEPVPVTELSAVRSSRTVEKQSRWSTMQWTSLAASLVLGIVIGRSAFDGRSADGLVADTILSRALSTPNAGAADKDSVRVGLSYLSKSGDYCRAFTFATENAAGIACRHDADWQIKIWMPAESNTNEYRTAGALPAAMASYIERDIDGEPLDAEGEASASRSDWRAPRSER